MFWNLPLKLPFLLAASYHTKNPVETFQSIYADLERPALRHHNVTETIRFNYVPPPLVNGTSVWRSALHHQCNEEAFYNTNSKPIAVYLPGLDGYGISGVQQFDDLADKFELWRVHIAHHDRSSLFEVTSAIASFVKNQTQKVVLIGESAGGFLAIATALRHSHNIKGLVLINPATSFDQTIWRDLVPVLTSLPNKYGGDQLGVSPYAVFGSLLLSAIIPDRQQKERIVKTLNIEPSIDSMTRMTNNMFSSMKNVEERLPAELLNHRVEEWLSVGVPLINQRLDRINLPTLVVAGSEDQLLPSKQEAQRLKAIWDHAEILNVPNRGHFVLDDTVNLTEAILFSKIFKKKMYDRIVDWKLPSDVSKYIASNVQPLRNIFSPVYFSTDQNGKRWSGMSRLPKTDKPIVFVANHQFVGADLQLIVADLFEGRGIVARGLAHPNLFTFAQRNLNFGELEGRTPGIFGNGDATTTLYGGFEKHGAVPVTPLNYYRLMQTGQNALLFPGGAAEALSGNKSYPLFWPDKVDFVRTAARFNATIVPLSAVGMVDSVNVLLEPHDLQNIPILGNAARQQAMNMPAARYDRKNGDDVFGFPVATPRIPQRNYFIFGRAINTENLDPSDKESCAEVYRQAKFEVERGIRDILRARRHDPYGGLPARFLYERIYRKKAPTFTVDKLN